MITYMKVEDLVKKTNNYEGGTIECRRTFLKTLPLEEVYSAKDLIKAINDFPKGSREQKDEFIKYLDIREDKPRAKRTFTMEIEWDKDPRFDIHFGCGFLMAKQLLLGMKDPVVGFVGFAENTNPTIKFVDMI